MKIALFSDIHANLPALEAFFADVEIHKPDAIYFLGDLVGYNIWPNEVIDEIRKRGIPTITGNYDFGIGRHSDDCGCAYKTDEDKAMGKISISYTNEIVKDKKLCLSPVIELFNGGIISYSLSESPNFKQISAMLQGAFKNMDTGARPILHSDQGRQYQMKQY